MRFIVNIQTCPSRECFKHALVEKIHRRNVSKLTFVVNSQPTCFVRVQTCACGVTQAFASSVSQDALVVNTQALTFQGSVEHVLVMNIQASPISRMFYSCACFEIKLSRFECGSSLRW